MEDHSTKLQRGTGLYLRKVRLRLQDAYIGVHGLLEANSSAAEEIHYCQPDPEARRLLVLADAGGSNGPRCRAWKVGLQHQLCDPFDLTVTVSHCPAGASKWNPIDHRVFSEISKNWAGHPLDSYETILNYLQTTQTSKGLRLSAHLVSKTYTKGVEVSDQQMQQLHLYPDPTLPRWNYTLICSQNGK